MNEMIYNNAHQILKNIYGPNAEFRDGQYDAIESTLINKRTIVVQKTGWGKSLVYFISAKLAGGITLIISPLLVLMDNQKMFAEKIGLRCAIINSKIRGNERESILQDIIAEKYDLLFTTPETLYSQDMQKIIHDLTSNYW